MGATNAARKPSHKTELLHSRILVSIGGNITDSYLYKAFGEELAVAGTTVNPMRFGGQVGYWRDLADRLYVRARHLRSDLGRWMSRDPIGFEGGDWNLYRYVGNEPVVDRDPSGFAVKFCWRPVYRGYPLQKTAHWFLCTTECGCLGYGPSGIM